MCQFHVFDYLILEVSTEKEEKKCIKLFRLVHILTMFKSFVDCVTQENNVYNFTAASFSQSGFFFNPLFRQLKTFLDIFTLQESIENDYNGYFLTVT